MTHPPTHNSAHNNMHHPSQTPKKLSPTLDPGHKRRHAEAHSPTLYTRLPSPEPQHTDGLTRVVSVLSAPSLHRARPRLRESALDPSFANRSLAKTGAKSHIGHKKRARRLVFLRYNGYLCMRNCAECACSTEHGPLRQDVKMYLRLGLKIKVEVPSNDDTLHL